MWNGEWEKEQDRRLCLEKKSTKFKLSEDSTTKGKKGGNKGTFTEFLLCSRSPIDRIAYNSLTCPLFTDEDSEAYTDSISCQGPKSGKWRVRGERVDDREMDGGLNVRLEG